MINHRLKLDAVFFRTEQGKEPIKAWLKLLSKQERLVIAEDITTVQYGWPLGMPLVRSLGSRLWEIRSRLSAHKIARIIFYTEHGCMVLLHAFIKKTQKTPHAELSLARKRMKQFKGKGYG